MSPRGRGGPFGRPLFWMVVFAAGLAAWWFLRPAPVDDRTQATSDAVKAIEGWARRRGLRLNEAGSRRDIRQDHGIRWLAFDLGYWHPPKRARAMLVRELFQLTGTQGLLARRGPSAPGTEAIQFSFKDGRPAGRVWMRPMCFVAIVIDDMGFNVPAARRVMALPCPLTCAIIPYSGNAKTVVRLALAAGKELYVHMPMESPFRVPDVPEYRLMLRPGMGRPEIEEKLRLALAEIPHAVGLNNHEGSLATENRELMDDLMAVLKPRNLVFMDSGTTEKTVAWKAARDAGIRWERRNVFLDSEYARPNRTRGVPRDPAAVEAEFSRLVALARQRGQAIAIGHSQFPETLEMLERRIPEARRRGVEFVFASWLAHVDR